MMKDNSHEPNAIEKSNKDTDAVDAVTIVGIGASAGGLEALQSFFKNVPIDSELAFVVIQHLSPNYKSLMDELLSRYTKLNIHKVTDGIVVEPNSIYLIPPRKNMMLYRGKLFLHEQDHSKGLNLPIDVFFKSLAEENGKKAIGVILSGTGSDGTQGIRSIKEAGGMVMVQDNRSAKFDGMPRSSISTGIVDFIMPPEDMPERIINYIQHPYITKSKFIEKIISKDEDILDKILLIVRDQTGIDFAFYKENTIIRRLEKRISINQLKNIEEYVNLLMESPREVKILSKDLLIGVTAFFRDPGAFDALRNHVLPEIVGQKKKGSVIRIWVPGCSTGEEAYSLAMLIKSYLDEYDIHQEVKIFATDIDKESVELAGNGTYPEGIISDLDPTLLQRFFKKTEDGYQINENIRKMVVFATHDLLRDPPFSKIDLISCRNLFIYLKPEIQNRILSMFYFALVKNGYMLLGSSESIGALSEAFEVIEAKWKIFRGKAGYNHVMNTNLSLPALRKIEQSLHNVQSFSVKPVGKLNINNVISDLVNEYIPPSVIVDENYNVIHIINNINPFISLQPGKITMNLLKMVPEELAVVLSSLLRKLMKEKSPVQYDNIRLSKEKNPNNINISGRYIIEKSSRQEFYLITFHEIIKSETAQKSIEKIDVESQYHERLTELEKELQFTKESLQATVEELESSNEELQSSNEELIASNEELQSTNEELQSVNEELYTVNNEYQNKIEELTELNNDIDNLLKNSNIGTLYLDSKLTIRKFTPGINQLLNILESDVGRPIHHFSLEHIDKNLLKDIETVYKTLEIKELEYKHSKNEWYLVRIIPYRTEKNAVSGIIITFTEITALKKSQQKLEQERTLLINILESSPMGQTMVDCDGKLTYANKKAQMIFKMSKNEIKKMRFDDNHWRILDLEGKEIIREQLPFSLIMKTKSPIYKFKHYIENKEKERVLLTINGSPMFDEKGNIEGAVFTFDSSEEE